MTYGSDDYVRDDQKQHNRAVNANGIAHSVNKPESLMAKGGNEMNQHVRKTKGVASDHPIPVLQNPFLFDLDERHYGYEQPD